MRGHTHSLIEKNKCPRLVVAEPVGDWAKRQRALSSSSGAQYKTWEVFW